MGGFIMKKVFLSLLVCALFASPALAAMSGADFVELSGTGSGTLQQINEAIEAGANVNATTGWGGTALMLAARFNPNHRVVTALLEAGADINARDAGGSTALMWAGNNRYPEVITAVITALIEAGADVNARDQNGNTALHHVTQFNLNPEAITVLLEAGADINVRDKHGSTPLMWAASGHRNPEVLTALLEAGADASAANVAGRTALDIIRENETLRDTGAYRRLYEASR